MKVECTDDFNSIKAAYLAEVTHLEVTNSHGFPSMYIATMAVLGSPL
jgi:hypothetical protein